MTRKQGPAFDTAPVLCPGGTVVCLATGPSLKPADVDYCREKATVIAVNDAWKLAPWADVLYSSDQYWYPTHRWVPQFYGLKVWMPEVEGNKFRIYERKGSQFRTTEQRPDGVLFLKRTGETGVEWSPHGLRSLKNSGGSAINLAVHLGARRIVLLGYDMGATGQGHFFGSHPQGLRNTRKDTYLVFQHMIATMVEPLRERGITVINATRRSALTCFPMMPLQQALPDAQQEAVA